MRRAIWQLQSADDSVQTMRQQQTQEASACTLQRQRAEEMDRRFREESKQSQQLVANLATAQTELRDLRRHVLVLEQELDTERAEHSASREAGCEECVIGPMVKGGMVWMRWGAMNCRYWDSALASLAWVR